MGLAAHIQSHIQRWLSSVQPLRAGDVGMDTATGRSRLWVGGFAQSVAVLGDLSGATPIQQQLAAGFATAAAQLLPGPWGPAAAILVKAAQGGRRGR